MAEKTKKTIGKTTKNQTNQRKAAKITKKPLEITKKNKKNKAAEEMANPVLLRATRCSRQCLMLRSSETNKY